MPQTTTDVMQQVIDKFYNDPKYGLVATLEYPGCIVLESADGGSWWFGTASEKWGASYMLSDGTVDASRYVETDALSTSQDADAIAAAIFHALMATVDADA